MPNEEVNIVEYNPAWANQFAHIFGKLMPELANYAATIEHVGSTSVPGLAAKPIIDMDVILETLAGLEAVRTILQLQGYEYLSYFKEYEMFVKYAPVKHHLFVTTKGSVMSENHLKFRDHLRGNAADREEYAKLKYDLAQDYKYDVERYTREKCGFVLKILRPYLPTPYLRKILDNSIYYGASQKKSPSLTKLIEKIVKEYLDQRGL